MLSSAAEFISVQVVSNTIWNLAESGVQFTQQFVHHYLTPPDQSETFADMEGSKPSPSKRIYCISFNQDCSCLAIGHDDGYSFYSLRSLDKLEKIQDAKVPERACIVEKLFNSSLITVVSMKSTRKLQVYHSKKENEICSHTYASSIIAVRMNRKRVIVCLEDAIHIHNVRDMRLMHMIKETPPNPQGIMDLSNDDNNCFLAFPASPSTGHVHIFDAENLNTLCQITAHDGMLASIRFNPEGNKLATGSEKGTVIRVFAVPSGERLFEFTRGVSRCVQISSLAFSQDSRYLCLSSNTETVHIFSLVKQHEQQQDHLHHLQKTDEPNQEGISAWMSYLSQQASAYLPQQVNDLMLREKSVATARLPIIGQKTIVAMPRIQDVDYLLVASLDGYLFCYSLPTTTEMGECRLMRQYRIGPSGKPGSEVNDGGNEDDVEGMPVSFGTRTSQRSSRASESETHNKIQQTPIKSGSMRTGGSYGSSSSLCSPNSQTPKQVPPPIPPNPPKRMPSKSSTPVKDQSKANVTNPFDMEDFVTPLNEDTGVIIDTHEKDGSEQTGTENEQANILPPTDLNDLDEFPPLHHATT